MQTRFVLPLLAFGLQVPSLVAQNKPPVKSGDKASKTVTTKTAGVAKPAGRPTAPAQPAKPAGTATTKPTAPPVTPAPAPAAPAKLEIPGIAAQQAPSFTKGAIAVNAGLGLGIGYGYTRDLDYAGKATSSPALSVSVEKGLLDGIGPGVISVGGLLGYKSYSYRWTIANQDHKASWTNVYVAARGAYHYNFTSNPKVDTYAGFSVAARIEKYSNTLDKPDANGGGLHLETGIFLGGRYMFTDKLGAFTELGYDMSYLKLGFTTKF